MAKATTKPLKIGLILDDTLDSSDGVQQYVLAIGQHFVQQGHTVHYLVGETKRSDLANVHSLSSNVAVRFNGNRLSIPLPASKRRIRQLLVAEQFDVLHVQMPYSPFLAARIVAAAAPQTAIVGTFHILPYSRLSRIGNSLLALALRRSLRRFQSVVSVSKAAQAYAKQQYGIASTVIPNAIDYHHFANVSKNLKPRDVPVILFLGRLVPRKGCQVLLQALQLLRRQHSEVRFQAMICGKGPLRQELEQYVYDNHLDESVIFTGFVAEEDKPAYYAASSLSVFPSSSGESFGIVLAEAMASGSAVVLAGDNPGYRAVMDAQQTLLFDPHNAQQLADLLHYYLTHEQQRAAMAAWGKEYSQMFDVVVVGEQLQKQYRQALRSTADL